MSESLSLIRAVCQSLFEIYSPASNEKSSNIIREKKSRAPSFKNKSRARYFAFSYCPFFGCPYMYWGRFLRFISSNYTMSLELIRCPS